MTSTDAIAAKERICFDHEQVRDQNKNAFLRLRSNVMVKALAIISRVMINHGAWLDHGVSLLLIFKLTAWIAANVYAYVHGHTRTLTIHDQHDEI